MADKLIYRLKIVAKTVRSLADLCDHDKALFLNGKRYHLFVDNDEAPRVFWFDFEDDQARELPRTKHGLALFIKDRGFREPDKFVWRTYGAYPTRWRPGNAAQLKTLRLAEQQVRNLRKKLDLPPATFPSVEE